MSRRPSLEGQEYPNGGIILALEPNKRIVTTDAINPTTYEPAGPFMVAEVTFEDIGNGKTKYRAVARHWTEETKEQHKQMGFHEGWGQPRASSKPWRKRSNAHAAAAVRTPREQRLRPTWPNRLLSLPRPLTQR